MNKHVRSWYQQEFNKYNMLHEKPAKLLSISEIDWLIHKMNQHSFDEKWHRYIQASHGTHVAGIITQDNPCAEIFSVKFIPDHTGDPELEHNRFLENISHSIPKSELKAEIRRHLIDIAKKIIDINQKEFDQLADYLNEKEISIVNGSYSMSLGFLDPYRKLFEQQEFEDLTSVINTQMHSSNLSMYKKLIEKTPNVLYVFAAGNDSSCNDKVPVFPSFMSSVSERVISVASVDVDGNLSHFSNYGEKNR